MKQIVVKDGKVIVDELVVDFMFKITTKEVFNIIPGLGDMTYRYDKEDIVDGYKRASDVLGCSVSQFANMLNGAIYKAYITPYQKWHSRFSIRGGKLIPYLVNKVLDNTSLLKKYDENKLSHMAMIPMLLGPDATKLIDVDMWLELYKNSCSRNDLIYKVASVAFPKSDYIEGIKFLNMLPSTVLRKNEAFSLYSLFCYCNCIDSGLSIISDYIRKHKGQYKQLDMDRVRHKCNGVVKFLDAGKYLGLTDERLAKYMRAKLNK